MNPSSWLDAAVVGPPDEFAGICVRFLDLSRLGERGGLFIRQLTNQLEDWCLLAPAAVPQRAADIVFKISRHRVEGRTITWLGFYRFAKFPRNSRDNTYVGVGIIACDCGMPVADALRFLRDAAHSMFDKGDTVHRSAGEIANALKLSPPAIRPQPLRDLGVREGGGERLYVDLSGFTGQELEAAVIRVLQTVEADTTFSTYSEVLVGTTLELRRSVAASRSYELVDDSGNPLEARPAEAPAAQAARSGYSAAERRKQATAVDALEGRGRPAESNFSTQARLDDAEHRIGRLEQQILKRRRGSESEETGGRGWMITAVVAMSVLIALACVLLVKWPFIGRFSAPDPVPSTTADVSRPSSVCVPPAAGDLSELGLEAARAEVQCLESELTAKRELVKNLEKLHEDGD